MQWGHLFMSPSISSHTHEKRFAFSFRGLYINFNYFPSFPSRLGSCLEEQKYFGDNCTEDFSEWTFTAIALQRKV